MNSTDLTKAQAAKVHAAMASTVGYLSRLVRRLDAQNFPPDDRLYVAAHKAQAAMSELVMCLHYFGCSGVGGPARSG